jgi:hypothetical protein
MGLDALSQRGGSHVAIGTVAADAKMRSPRSGIKAHELHGKSVDSQQRSHPDEGGANPRLDLDYVPLTATTKSAHSANYSAALDERYALSLTVSTSAGTSFSPSRPRKLRASSITR